MSRRTSLFIAWHQLLNILESLCNSIPFFSFYLFLLDLATIFCPTSFTSPIKNSHLLLGNILYVLRSLFLLCHFGDTCMVLILFLAVFYTIFNLPSIVIVTFIWIYTYFEFPFLFI